MGSSFPRSLRSSPVFKTLEKSPSRVPVWVLPTSKSLLFQSPRFSYHMLSFIRNSSSVGITEASSRIWEVKRVTKETDVYVKMNLDGSGISDCSTGIPFLDHMLDDLFGHHHLSFDSWIPTQRVGTYDTQLVEHFFQSLVNTSGMTLHIYQRAGRNSHHIIEATFKAFARALRQATEYDPRRRGSVPCSKGVLSRSYDLK